MEYFFPSLSFNLLRLKCGMSILGRSCGCPLIGTFLAIQIFSPGVKHLVSFQELGVKNG